MKTSTAQGKSATQWTAWMQLDDMDFTNNPALLSHTQQQIQMKTANVTPASEAAGFNIHKGGKQDP